MSRRFVLTVTLLSAVLLAGCGKTLKSGWNNFRAYYNTHYNAKEYFKEGEKAVRQQPRSLNPDSPVRVHPPPSPAGKESFEQAIVKSSRILRRHNTSVWLDDALLLMGKSYYYLQDYAAAIKRLEQVEDADPSPETYRQAMIWKGRAMLDLGVHSEGIAYLGEMLGQYPTEWPEDEKGELQILAGEHHAMLGNWEEASGFLSAALSNVSDRRLRGRAFFLYGQLLERQNRPGEAYYAYSQVPSHFVGFEYDYWSRLKQAEVSREQDNLGVALAIYRRMQQNDKYVDRRERLTFEMARTLEMQGETGEAEGLYRSLLYGDPPTDLRSLQADIHYRLGRIQSDHHQNYAMAAAYFDSSAALRGQAENPEDEEAAVLAEAFGRYTGLKQSIERADSLLRLGSLPRAALDSLLERVRANRREQLLRQRQEEEEGAGQGDRLMNQPALTDAAGTDTTNRSGIYGFLNHRNPNLMERAKAEFRVLWGERPLTDNWRRREAIGAAGGGAQPNEEDPAGALAGDNSADRDRDREKEMEMDMDLEENKNNETGAPSPDREGDIGINREAIPRTEAERARLREERAADQYRLGNLLFLDLDQPDSARVYYHAIVREKANPDLRPRAMYALYETYSTTGPSDSLRYWGDRIAREYPGSEFAQLVRGNREQGAGAAVTAGRGDRLQGLRDQLQAVESGGDGAPGSSKASRLRSLALEHRDSELAPHIHYRAIEAYIGDAKTLQWIADLQLERLLASPGDPAELPARQGVGIRRPVPVSGASGQPGGSAYAAPYAGGYRGAHWDSVRTVLAEHEEIFEGSPYRGDVRRLREAVGR
ncbi:Tetratricopeptide repeat-containing protein [Fodinibius roseus]|uniref:Tetratricopeptide repeat-containing protein n=1 Tax=Fodinibius roseus TaxID=1194090 RepID=A0A1M5E3E2_9BACT|nr:tetratricopeptide repeat protein [Fodinibius roseus]SHF73769.1 Tetratricopeptide repeat-containing protein [Fodinibius roseus]